MNDLTTFQKLILNQISQERSISVSLGNKLQEIIDELQAIVVPQVQTVIETALAVPLNAAEASTLLTLTSDVLHQDMVMIGHFEGEGLETFTGDCYVFNSALDQDLGEFGDQAPEGFNIISVDINALTSMATVELTLATQPTSGDTLTLDGKVYTFVPVGTDTADGEVSIGANLAGAQQALQAAINGTDGINIPHPTVYTGGCVNNVFTITARAGGSAGNSIEVSETFTAVGNVLSAETLTLGSDASYPGALALLIEAINAHDTQGVEASEGESTAEVVITAKVPGVSGNSIQASSSLENGGFPLVGVNSLIGGTDGTLASGNKFVLSPDGGLFICIGGNTASGQNWKFIESTQYVGGIT